MELENIEKIRKSISNLNMNDETYKEMADLAFPLLCTTVHIMLQTTNMHIRKLLRQPRISEYTETMNVPTATAYPI